MLPCCDENAFSWVYYAIFLFVVVYRNRFPIASEPPVVNLKWVGIFDLNFVVAPKVSFQNYYSVR